MGTKSAVKHIDAAAEASALVRGIRARTYGPPRNNARRIARAWSAYGFRVEDSHGNFRDVTEHDMTQAMILLKVVRQADGYHRDSVVDTVGYALLDEIVSDDAANTAYAKETA